MKFLAGLVALTTITFCHASESQYVDPVYAYRMTLEDGWEDIGDDLREEFVSELGLADSLNMEFRAIFQHWSADDNYSPRIIVHVVKSPIPSIVGFHAGLVSQNKNANGSCKTPDGDILTQETSDTEYAENLKRFMWTQRSRIEDESGVYSDQSGLCSVFLISSGVLCVSCWAPSQQYATHAAMFSNTINSVIIPENITYNKITAREASPRSTFRPRSTTPEKDMKEAFLRGARIAFGYSVLGLIIFGIRRLILLIQKKWQKAKTKQ